MYIINMSFKSTIFLTEDNEHCYKDEYSEEIVFEFKLDYLSDVCKIQNSGELRIKKGNPLYLVFEKMYQEKYGGTHEK